MKTAAIARGSFDDCDGIEVVEVTRNEDEETAPKNAAEIEAYCSDPTDTTLVMTEHDVSSPFGSSTTPSPQKSSRRQPLPWYKHPRITELYLKADWWTLWVGLLSFGLAVILVFAIPLNSEERVKYVVPQPKSWEQNPLDAWDVYNLVGIPLLLLVLMGLYLISLKAMGSLVQKEESEDGETITRPYGHLPNYIKGFIFISILATLSLWLGSNTWASKQGLGYAVFAIVLGMLVTNLPGLKERTKWAEKTAKDGEYFIKCSLVLLAVELTVLAQVGGPAMIVTWIGSPLAIIIGFGVGTRLLNCKDTLAMLIAVGASWCGASAISAVAPVVMASSEDVALSISVVSFFTVIFTFVQPYIAMAVGMPDAVAGAWIGGSVDQTGNVIVSAAIISEEATEVAGIVKMVLNAGMGVMASVIACYWSTCRSSSFPGEEGEKPKLNLMMLYDKFPKFTLGFIITSAIMTGMLQNMEGTLEAEAFPKAVSTLNKWWFALAFVGIGLTTDLSILLKQAWNSGVIQVYLFANTVDIFLALGLAYLVYR